MKFRPPSGLIVAACLMFASCNASAQNGVEVAAFAKEAKNGHVMLMFNLKNCGQKEIAIYYGELPWHQTYTTVAIFVGTGKFAAEVPGLSIIADYPAHVIHVGPGESQHGAIDLNLLFPAIKKVKDKSELIIFWSYMFHDSFETTKKLFGGMATLGNNSSKNVTCLN